MHETALMQNMLSIVEKSIEGHNVKRVNSITLSVGKLSNAMPDALSFAFEAMTADSALKGAVLNIKEVPVLVKCEDCGEEYKPDDFPFICPECSSRIYTITQGEDIYVDSIDCII